MKLLSPIAESIEPRYMMAATVFSPSAAGTTWTYQVFDNGQRYIDKEIVESRTRTLFGAQVRAVVHQKSNNIISFSFSSYSGGNSAWYGTIDSNYNGILFYNPISSPSVIAIGQSVQSSGIAYFVLKGKYISATYKAITTIVDSKRISTSVGRVKAIEVKQYLSVSANGVKGGHSYMLSTAITNTDWLSPGIGNVLSTSTGTSDFQLDDQKEHTDVSVSGSLISYKIPQAVARKSLFSIEQIADLIDL